MAETQAAENHGDEWVLTWYLKSGMYASFPMRTHSQNSLAAAEALSLNISSHGTSLKWSQTGMRIVSIRYENSHKLWDEMGHPLLSLTESQYKLGQPRDQNFPMEGKPL